MSLSNSRHDAFRDLPGHTEEDRIRIKHEAARSVLEDCDNDRNDPSWIRYCARHGLDANEAGR